MFFPALLLPALVYLLTFSPTIYWRDSPEVVDAAYTLGILHPAGSPVYSLIGKIWTYLPIGTIPLRTNVLSLLAALAAVALTGACATDIVSRIASDLSPREKSLTATLPALLFSFSAPFWHNALITEVYTLNILFVAATVLLTLRWERTADERLILGSGFFYGLTLGIHAPSVFFVPAFLGFFLWKNVSRQLKKLPTVLFFVLLGLSAYLYLQVRAMTDPPFNWGNPKTLSGFWTQVSDEKDRIYHFAQINKPDSFTQLRDRAAMATKDLTPFLMLFSVIGGFALRKRPALLILLMGILIGNLLFFVGWDTGTIFFPSYFVLALLASAGMAYFFGPARRMSGSPLRPAFLVWVLGVGLVPFLIVKNWSRVQLSEFFLPREASASSLYQLEPGGTVLAGNLWFHYRYHQDIEGLRDDIGVASAGQFNRTKYFGPPRDEDLRGLRLPERPLPGEGRSRDFLEALIALNAGTRPLYWGMDAELSSPFWDWLVPENAFLFRAHPEKLRPGRAEILSYLSGLETDLSRQIKSEGFFRDDEVAEWYLPFLPTLAHYLKRQGYPAHALRVGNVTYSWFEKKARERGFDQDIGMLYLANGNDTKAQEYFKRHLEFFPDNALSLYNLGILLAEEGNHREALTRMIHAARLSPEEARIHQALSAIYDALGNRSSAEREWKESLKWSHGSKESDSSPLRR